MIFNVRRDPMVRTKNRVNTKWPADILASNLNPRDMFLKLCEYDSKCWYLTKMFLALMSYKQLYLWFEWWDKLTVIHTECQ
jgi:hypothetical protein